MRYEQRATRSCTALPNLHQTPAYHISGSLCRAADMGADTTGAAVAHEAGAASPPARHPTLLEEPEGIAALGAEPLQLQQQQRPQRQRGAVFLRLLSWDLCDWAVHLGGLRSSSSSSSERGWQAGRLRLGDTENLAHGTRYAPACVQDV